MLVFGTPPKICYAGGMTSYLYEHQVKIFDYAHFAEPFRNQLRANAERLAAENAWSYLPGSVVPGELVTLVRTGIGPSLAQITGGSSTKTVLGGTSVLFDSKPAPILYGSPNQINAIVVYRVLDANFIDGAACFIGELKAAHPFREGNGRTQREFIRQLGLKAGHYIDWRSTTAEKMSQASRLSHLSGESSLFASLIRSCIRSG